MTTPQRPVTCRYDSLQWEWSGGKKVYSLEVNAQVVQIGPIDALFNHRHVSRAVMQQCGVVPPYLARTAWTDVLRGLFAAKQQEDAKEEMPW